MSAWALSSDRATLDLLHCTNTTMHGKQRASTFKNPSKVFITATTSSSTAPDFLVIRNRSSSIFSTATTTFEHTRLPSLPPRNFEPYTPLHRPPWPVLVGKTRLRRSPPPRRYLLPRRPATRLHPHSVHSDDPQIEEHFDHWPTHVLGQCRCGSEESICSRPFCYACRAGYDLSWTWLGLHHYAGHNRGVHLARPG